jgi:hypothetical protein
MKEFPQTLAAVESAERGVWPIAEALTEEIAATANGSAKAGEYDRAAKYLADKGYPSYSARRIEQFFQLGTWMKRAPAPARDFTQYPFERVVEAKKKARGDHANALAILQETTSKRQIRPDRITPTQVARAVKGMTDDEVKKVRNAATEEEIERWRPKIEKGNQHQRAKQTERLKRNPLLALMRFGSAISRTRGANRSLILAYQEFLALVDDEDVREEAREHLIAFRASMDIALGEVLEGSYEDALERLMDKEASA